MQYFIWNSIMKKTSKFYLTLFFSIPYLHAMEEEDKTKAIVLISCKATELPNFLDEGKIIMLDK